ncbi:MAG: 50S ribosomal protein L2 [Candidatus Omnitrophica bacterium]|nr:50S ribosomal protein L2 [Candidatus Omnitrophota bacterium]
MAIRKLNPVTPGQRKASLPTFAEVTADRPYRPLTEASRKRGGRNVHGHITAKYRGGGHRRRYRLIDFTRSRFVNIPASVRTIEYDPNRTGRIALIEYENKEKSYVLAPEGAQVGQKVMSGPDAPIAPGNTLPLSKIPPGTPIFNIELIKGRGGTLVRSAGSSATILSKEEGMAHVRLPSGEVRRFPEDCSATIGQVSNADHVNVQLGKAGRNRWKGRRPRTRPRAMNPVDHPLGGGEGKSAGGRHPCDFYGRPSKGYKTRRRAKPSDRFIVERRK